MPTINELKAQLRALGLSTSGTKLQLERRLEAVHKAAAAEQASSQTRNFAGDGDAGKRMRVESPHDSGAETLFEQFSGGADAIDAEKTLEMCSALGVDPEALDAIALSYYFNSPAMGTFERAGFIKGAEMIKVDSLASLKSKLPYLTQSAKFRSRDFDGVYRFVFSWACEPGIRNLNKDVALGLWRLLIPASAFPLLEEWIKFWESRSARVVTKDEWNSFRRFIDAYENKQIELLTVDDAWPSAIDEFVELLNKQGKLVQSDSNQ